MRNQGTRLPTSWWRNQASNQLVEEPSFHDGGILDHPEVVETSYREEEVLEHSRGIEFKRTRLNDTVRVRSWCLPTHQRDYDLRRWWRMVENIQHDRQRRTPALRNGKRRPPSTMNLTWLSYWWRRMERQAADDQKTKLEIKEQRSGAQRILCFFMSGKTSTSKTLQNGDKQQENELTCT